MSAAHSIQIEGAWDADRAAILSQSLSPEASDLADARSTTTIAVDDGTLLIDIEAADLVALRAAVNTWMSLLATAHTTYDITKQGY